MFFESHHSAQAKLPRTPHYPRKAEGKKNRFWSFLGSSSLNYGLNANVCMLGFPTCIRSTYQYISSDSSNLWWAGDACGSTML